MYSLTEMGKAHIAEAGRKSETQTSQKRKRRLMVVLAVCWAVGASMAFHMWNGVASADATGSWYTVQPGDTVWSIASRFNHGEDPRSFMDTIMTDNHLGADGAIQPGQVLILPAK